jgi:hypothetical protein
MIDNILLFCIVGAVGAWAAVEVVFFVAAK